MVRFTLVDEPAHLSLRSLELRHEFVGARSIILIASRHFSDLACTNKSATRKPVCLSFISNHEVIQQRSA